MPSLNLFTGAQVVLKCEGTVVAHMTDVSIDRSWTNARLEECGTPITAAIVKVGLQVNLSASFARVTLASEDSKSKGFTPGSDPTEILTWPEKDYEVYDVVSGECKGKVIGCQPNSEGLIQGNARALLMGNIRWECRNFKHASEL